MVPVWLKHGFGMVQKNQTTWKWFCEPTKSVLKSLKNIRAIASLRLHLGQTWSQHGPSMALTRSQIVEPLQTYTLSQSDLVLKF